MQDLNLRLHWNDDGSISVINNSTRAVRDLGEQAQQTGTRINNMADQIRRSEAEARRLEETNRRWAQEGQRLAETLITPMQRYQQSIASLRQHLNDGHISQQNFNIGAARAREELDRSSAGASRFASAITGLGAAFAGLAIGRVASQLFDVNRAMNSARNDLITSAGSYEAAIKQFDRLNSFKITPIVGVNEISTDFARLSNLSLKAGEDAITAYANIAAGSKGKTTIDFIEAVADAVVGENERLKEFGIRVQKNGDDVAFTWRGVTTTVKNNADEIQNYLINIGKTDFAGAISRKAAKMDGGLKVLINSLDTFYDHLITLERESKIADFFKSVADSIHLIDIALNGTNSIDDRITVLNKSIADREQAIQNKQRGGRGFSYNPVTESEANALISEIRNRDKLIELKKQDAEASNNLNKIKNSPGNNDAVEKEIKGNERLNSILTGQYKQLIINAAERAKIRPNDFLALIENETSSGRNIKTSSAGAQGISQIMPDTASELAGRLGTTQKAVLTDIKTSLDAGALYYRQKLDEVVKSGKVAEDQAASFAAAAYNAGFGSLQKHKFNLVSMSQETIDYVRKFKENVAGLDAISGKVKDAAPKQNTKSTFEAVTAQEKYLKSLLDIDQQLKTGAITQDGYNQKLEDAQAAYDKATGLSDQYTDALKRQQAAWDESVNQANALDKLKDDAAGAERIANRAEELRLQGLSSDRISQQIKLERELNSAVEANPNLDPNQVLKYSQQRIDAENKLNGLINSHTEEQSAGYKRMLENIQDAGAKMFEDLFNGDGVKSFSSFLDTIKSAFIKVISQDFSRALGTLFSGSKTDWAGIFTGALAVGISAISNLLTSDKKTTTPSIATTAANTNIYGTGSMAIGDTAGRSVYLSAMSETVRKYNEQFNLLTSIIRSQGAKIFEVASTYITKFAQQLFGSQVLGVVSKFASGISAAYNSVVSFGTELVGGVSKIVSNAWSAISGVTQAAASTSAATAGATAGNAASSSGSSIPYAGEVVALLMLGYNLFQIAANNYTTTLEKVSQSFYAAESAAVAVLGVANPLAWIVGGILRVVGSVTQISSGDFAGGISNLLGGHIGGLISDMFKNDPSATILSYTKANPESQYDQTGSYFTSRGTQSASVGVETPFGYVDARLNDVGNVVGTKEAIDAFLPLLKTVQAFDVALAAGINNVDVMFGQSGTIDKFKGLFKQTEHQQDLSGLNTSEFISQRLDDISKVMAQTGTIAGQTFNVWWDAFSGKLLKPANNENAQYNATTSFNIEAFIAAQLPKLAQLPVKLADLFVASVKSVADGATQAQFEGQMNDFFTGWSIAEQGLKDIGINIENTALPEYLTSLTKIGFTVKDGAIALVKYADTFAYAGSTASDKFNAAFNQIFDTAKNKGYSSEQTTGIISSYTTFGGTFKDLGVSVTNDALVTLAEKLNNTATTATQAANDLIDHAIADAGLGNKSRETAIQLLVLQGKLDDSKITAASYGKALVDAQQQIMQGIDFVSQVVAGTGVEFDSLGLSATELANVSDVLITRFGDMKTAISETAAFIETAFGKNALTQYQSNQAFSQQQSIIDRNPQFADYGLFAGMNSEQLQAANVAAANAFGIGLNDLIAQGVKLMVSNPDLQTFVNLTKTFDPATNQTGFKYNTDFSQALKPATTATSTAVDNTPQQTIDNSAETRKNAIASERKTLESELLTLEGDKLKIRAAELAALDESNRALKQQIYDMTDAKAATEAWNKTLESWKTVQSEFDNIGKTDIEKSIDAANSFFNEQYKIIVDAFNNGSIDVSQGISALGTALTVFQSRLNALVTDINSANNTVLKNQGKTENQIGIAGIFDKYFGQQSTINAANTASQTNAQKALTAAQSGLSNIKTSADSWLSQWAGSPDIQSLRGQLRNASNNTDLNNIAVFLQRKGQTDPSAAAWLNQNINTLNNYADQLKNAFNSLATATTNYQKVVGSTTGAAKTNIDALWSEVVGFFKPIKTDLDTLKRSDYQNALSAVSDYVSNWKSAIDEAERLALSLATNASDKANISVNATNYRAQLTAVENARKAAVEQQYRQPLLDEIYKLSHTEAQNLAYSRQKELDAMDASLRPLQETINRFTDLKEAATKTADELKNVTDSLDSLIKQLKGEASGQSSYDAARSTLTLTIDQALAGNFTNIANAVDQFSALTGDNAKLFSSASEYRKAQQLNINALEYLRSLTGTKLSSAQSMQIPGFASGGQHSGGWRMVGEVGRELEYTGPSTIFNNATTERLLNTEELVKELRELKAEMQQARDENRQLQIKIHKNLKTVADLAEKSEAIGTPPVRA